MNSEVKESTNCTAHTFCTSRNGQRKSGFLQCLLKQRYFCAVYNYAGKMILARVIGIRKENWGYNHALFGEFKLQSWAIGNMGFD